MPLVIGIIAVAVVVMLALVPLAQAADQRAQARTAADAAALAGAVEGGQAARDIAAANGAELVDWGAQGSDFWVEVTLGDASARARARRG